MELLKAEPQPEVTAAPAKAVTELVNHQVTEPELLLLDQLLAVTDQVPELEDTEPNSNHRVTVPNSKSQVTEPHRVPQLAVTVVVNKLQPEDTADNSNRLAVTEEPAVPSQAVTVVLPPLLSNQADTELPRSPVTEPETAEPPLEVTEPNNSHQATVPSSRPDTAPQLNNRQVTEPNNRQATERVAQATERTTPQSSQ